MLYATMNNKLVCLRGYSAPPFCSHMSPLLSGSFVVVLSGLYGAKALLGMRQFLFFGLSDRECLA